MDVKVLGAILLVAGLFVGFVGGKISATPQINELGDEVNKLTGQVVAIENLENQLTEVKAQLEKVNVNDLYGLVKVGGSAKAYKIGDMNGMPPTIANDVIGSLTKEERIIILDEVKVKSGNKSTPTAFVKLKINDEIITGEGKGVGTIDSVCNAIRTVIGPDIRLKDFHLKAITGGTNALCDVIITVEDKNGNIFKAESVDDDIMMASTKAFIQGINKALNFSKHAKKTFGRIV